MDLANWALRTSPKFHQGFRSDQRSGNPNHPSPHIYGRGSSRSKALGYGLDGPGSIPGGDFSLFLRVQTGPEVHSTSYKMITGGFPRGGGKGGQV